MTLPCELGGNFMKREETESWMDIVGFEGYYRVSDSGRVASLDRPKVGGERARKGREIRQHGAQPQVDLMVHGERKRFMVSRLVAHHFIRPIGVDDCVFHLDLNRMNNAVTNLQVMTFGEAQRATREIICSFEYIQRANMTKEKAIEYLEYKDGRLFWRKRTSMNNVVGEEAGFLQKGHWRVHFLGNTYMRNQLVYLMHYGYLPDYALPKDGDYLNSRIENIFPATASQWATISQRRDNLVAAQKPSRAAPERQT